MFTFLVFLAVIFGFFFYLFSCYTVVAEGTAKQVVRFGEYRKTLFVKKGYKLDENCELIPDTSYKTFWQKLLGGARWVSWLKPLGIDKIYNQIENFPDENLNGIKTNFILTGTQFQYGLEFTKMEDNNMLPLSGKITMTVVVTNPYKAVFLIKNWFDALVLRILPFVRQYISEHTYEQILNDHEVRLDADIFLLLNQSGNNGEPSTFSVLKDQYGITLLALETVNIDPPPEYRKVTLKEWQAKQNVKVAKQNKEVEVEETSGALEIMIKNQIEAMEKNCDCKLSKQEKLQIRQECINILLRDRAAKNGEFSDIRVGNADGTSFVGGSIAEIIGGAIAVFHQFKEKSSKNPGGGKVQQQERQNIEQAAQEFFDKNGIYPRWDPLKRGPKKP